MDKRTQTERAYDAGYREGFRKATDPLCRLARDEADRAFEERMNEHRAQLLMEAILNRTYADNLLGDIIRERERFHEKRDVELLDLLIRIHDDYRLQRKIEKQKIDTERIRERRRTDEELRKKRKEYQLEWLNKNREHTRAYQREWWAKNKDRCNAERKERRDAAKRQAEISNSRAGASEGPLPGGSVEERRSH